MGKYTNEFTSGAPVQIIYEKGSIYSPDRSSECKKIGWILEMEGDSYFISDSVLFDGEGKDKLKHVIRDSSSLYSWILTEFSDETIYRLPGSSLFERFSPYDSLQPLLKTSKLKCGDTVYLMDDRYANTPYNPLGIPGVILHAKFSDSERFQVEWSNGNSNNYSEADLSLVNISSISPLFDSPKVFRAKELAKEVAKESTKTQVKEVETPKIKRVKKRARSLKASNNYHSAQVIKKC